MSASSANSDDWIRRFHEAPDAKVRLVCFPHAGGSASFYFPVSRQLTPGVEVLAVQYPGRQDRRAEPNVDSIPEVADRVTAALGGSLDRPVALFGHSLGAVLAYEVGLRLEAGGRKLVRLFASGRRAPSRYREEDVHRRTDAGIVEELRSLSGTEAGFLTDPEILQMIMPAIRGDYRLIETYRHEPDRRLDAPITALTGDDDPKTSLDEAKAWSEHTTGEFDLRIFPGDHFFVISQARRVLEVVAEQLR